MNMDRHTYQALMRCLPLEIQSGSVEICAAESVDVYGVCITVRYRSRGGELQYGFYINVPFEPTADANATAVRTLLSRYGQDLVHCMSDGGPTSEQRREDYERRTEAAELAQWCVL